MVEILSPEWKVEVRNRYKGPDRSYTFTKAGFARYPEIDKEMRDYLLQTPDKANVLCVGIGKIKSDENGQTYCGTLPFEIAAILEAQEKDYRMSIWDIDGEILNLVRTAEAIRSPFSFKINELFPERFSPFNESRFDLWKKYLEDTKQVFPGDESIRIQRKSLDDRIIDAVLSADIPKSFRRKRGNKDISFVQGDVMTADLTRYGPFDFIHCLNVLCHIPFDNRFESLGINDRDFLTLALYNMIRNLRKGGIMVVDDIHNTNTDTFLQSLSIVEDVFAARGVANVEKNISLNSKHSYIFVRKDKSS